MVMTALSLLASAAISVGCSLMYVILPASPVQPLATNSSGPKRVRFLNAASSSSSQIDQVTEPSPSKLFTFFPNHFEIKKENTEHVLQLCRSEIKAQNTAQKEEVYSKLLQLIKHNTPDLEQTREEVHQLSEEARKLRAELQDSETHELQEEVLPCQCVRAEQSQQQRCCLGSSFGKADRDGSSSGG
eukprot:2423513-Rhodomonas_salina.1